MISGFPFVDFAAYCAHIELNSMERYGPRTESASAQSNRRLAAAVRPKWRSNG